MKVRFYGKLAAAISPQLEIEPGELNTVAALRRHLQTAFPHASEALGDGRVKAVVGETVVPDDHPLADADEVEFLAPVSGG